jgi:hypothetical protein
MRRTLARPRDCQQLVQHYSGASTLGDAAADQTPSMPAFLDPSTSDHGHTPATLSVLAFESKTERPFVIKHVVSVDKDDRIAARSAAMHSAFRRKYCSFARLSYLQFVSW